MFKEAGEFANAECHYLEAYGLAPDDADLALQLGHFYKRSSRWNDAAQHYARALELQPDWNEPMAELRAIRQRAGGSDVQLHDTASAIENVPDALRFDEYAEDLTRADATGWLAPELVARSRQEMLWPHHDAIVVRRFERVERSRWGMLPTLRGVEAIRGFCNASVPIVELHLLINGEVVHRSIPRGGYVLQFAEPASPIRKYVFNIWYDFAPCSWGRASVELRCIDVNGGTRSHHEAVVIAEPLSEALHPASDAIITLPPFDGRPLVEEINARPTMVRSAKRSNFAEPISAVLVLRTDQLGDMVSSLPAMQRLRDLLPTARLVGLLTEANAAFAETLNIFSEIITIDFPDDAEQRKRIMSLAGQEALRARLAPYKFDLALDLAEAGVSRPLLLLSGAPILCGFHDRDWPWLTIGAEVNTHARANGREMLPHSSRVLAFVEGIGALIESQAKILRRDDLTRDRLASYGVAQGERFAVLHQGARIAFSRWGHYDALARLICERSDLKVVLFTNDPEYRRRMDADLLGTGRLVLIDTLLPFDDFDAFLSFCTVFVGNDSGPKHLAALRGANVISIHSARVNWQEWGQENVGVILSRKVPCAGCQLYHDEDECGQDFTCVTRITPAEVFEAVAQYL